MDNNDFFNNDNDEQNEKDALDDDIFAEETVEDDQDNGDQTSHNDSEQNAGQQQSWNQNRVNPDQWQAYRNQQHNGNPYGQQNGSGNQQYGPNGGYQQNPYQNYGYNGYYRPDNSKGFGIASMVLGIISLLCFCSFINLLPAVLAIVFGIISLSRKKDNGFAIAGIVCGAISVALLIVTCVLFAANADLMSAFRDYMNQYSGNGFNYYFGN